MNKDVESTQPTEDKSTQPTEDKRSLLECVEAMVPVLDRYVRVLRNVNDTEALGLTNLLSDARYVVDRAKSDEIAEKFKERESLQNDDCDDVRHHCGKCGCEFCQCGVGSDEDILDDEEEVLLDKLCDVVENELNAIFKCLHSREQIKKRLQRVLNGDGRS